MLEGIKTPFRFYEKKENQTFRRCECEAATGTASAFKLITNTEIILPFQLKRPGFGPPISVFELWSINQTTGAEVLVKNMLLTIPATGTGFFDILNFGTEDYILFYGTDTPGLLPAGGPYYFVFGDGINTFYSEVFSVLDFNIDTQNLI